MPREYLQDEDIYLTPHPASKVVIVNALGQRLVLHAENGETFYFDVAAHRYVTSLTELAPTPTRVLPAGLAHNQYLEMALDILIQKRTRSNNESDRNFLSMTIENLIGALNPS